jgi:hypothetical protein
MAPDLWDTLYIFSVHTTPLDYSTKSFENVAKLKHSEATVTNKNCIYRETKSRLNSGNACCHAVQNLLSSCLFKM